MLDAVGTIFALTWRRATAAGVGAGSLPASPGFFALFVNFVVCALVSLASPSREETALRASTLRSERPELDAMG